MDMYIWHNLRYLKLIKDHINKKKTYFGALDVIIKILLDSKDLNIFRLYIIKKILFNFY